MLFFRGIYCLSFGVVFFRYFFIDGYYFVVIIIILEIGYYISLMVLVGEIFEGCNLKCS